MNMRYCQFRNTAGDLQDCFETLQALQDRDEDEELSSDELTAAIHLTKICQSILSLLEEELGLEEEEFDAEAHAQPALEKLAKRGK